MISPKVTIAIPTYNRAALLRQAVESALEQTYQDIEVLVADNSSTDNTGDVVKQFKDHRIRYFRHSKNRGFINNFNFCLEKAAGEYFLLLSDDDILDNDAIKSLLARFQGDDDVMSYCSLIFFNENAGTKKIVQKIAPEKESGFDFIAGRLAEKRVWAPSAALFRTCVLRSAGGYPPAGIATDLGACLAGCMKGTVGYVPRPLVYYRLHENNVSQITKYSITSHVDLINWSSSPGSPVYGQRDRVYHYCVQILNRMTYSAAQRGNREVFAFAADILRRLSPGFGQEARLKLYSIPNIKYAVSFLFYIKDCFAAVFLTARTWTRAKVLRHPETAAEKNLQIHQV
ncbi:glycosyltransferase family 2 protein [Pelotomaculum propionicicum]|uniref:glycosyltransferase family 2 protein n=1 Tax=Pelotomaculum propionicicum TaxID=258475 RepID=UPI003B7EF45E